jgi:uncharacterized protein
VAADQIEVVGSANRDVEPDQATWLAEVVVADADHRAAFDRCAERAAALVERLAPLGEASTGIVSVEPRLSPDRERWAGHEAKATVSVRCAVATVGEAARAAMESGADRLHGPVLTATDADAVREELLAEAVAMARRKAQRVADAAGRSVARVLSVSEDREVTVRPMAAVARFESGGGALHAPPVRPDALALSARVTLVVELVD